MQTRHMIFSAILLVCSGAAYAHALPSPRLAVVSDIDDTIRVTHVADPFDRLLKFAFSNRSFSGMPELFSKWSRSTAISRFFYLSAAPDFLRTRVEGYLKNQFFPQGQVFLRKKSDGEDFLAYKISKLEGILSATSERLILVGDDTEWDSSAYLETLRRHPERIAAIYIRSVRGVQQFPEVSSFLTSYDVARYEYGFRRLKLEDVKAVAQRIVLDPKSRRILPRFQKCRELPSGSDLGEEIGELDRLVKTRIDSICRSRES